MNKSLLFYNKRLFEEAGIDGPPNTVDELLAQAKSIAALGGRDNIPLKRLLEGALAEPMSDMPATSIRFHRAPLPHEFRWDLQMQDQEGGDARYYYARERLKNGHHAWASPIFVGR